MTIKYFANTLNDLLKTKFKECNMDVFVSHQKSYVGTEFGKPLMSIKNKDEIIQFIFDQWENYNDRLNYMKVFQL